MDCSYKLQAAAKLRAAAQQSGFQTPWAFIIPNRLKRRKELEKIRRSCDR